MQEPLERISSRLTWRGADTAFVILFELILWVATVVAFEGWNPWR